MVTGIGTMQTAPTKMNGNIPTSAAAEPVKRASDNRRVSGCLRIYSHKKKKIFSIFDKKSPKIDATGSFIFF